MTKDMYTFWGLWVGSVVLISTINVVLFSNTYLNMEFFTSTIFLTLLSSGLSVDLLKTHKEETIVFSISFVIISVISIIYYYDYNLPDNFPKVFLSASFFISMIITGIYSKISTIIKDKVLQEDVSLDAPTVDLNPAVDEEDENQHKEALSTEKKISYPCNYTAKHKQPANTVIEPNPFIDEDGEYQPKKVLSNEKKITYHCNYTAKHKQPENTVIEPNPFIDEDGEYQPKNVLSNKNKIKCFDKYQPWYGGKNNSFNHFSRKILDLKNGKYGSVNYFFELLKGEFDSNIDVIVIVPSHDPLNSHSSVRQLAQELASYHHWYDGTGIVRRTKKINKLSQGGSRDKKIHLDSLTISKPSLIKNKNVLVFDDVTTSGNSLYATMQLLNKSGVNSVYGYAIGNTE